MTVTSSTSKAGPYDGNDLTTAWPFSFRILDATHIRVIITDADGAETTADPSDYDVSGIGATSGTVTYPNFGSPLATGYKITILRDMPFTQEVDIANAGAFYPQTHEDVFDTLTMMIQQNAEEVARAVKVSPSSDTDPDELIAELMATAAAVAASEAVAAASAVLAGEHADDAEAAELAAETARDVVLEAIVGIGTIGAMTVNQFTGNGVRTTDTLTVTPQTENNTWVYFDGVYQQKNTYSVAGAIITYSTAPANGVVIEIVTGSSLPVGALVDASVTTATIDALAVTTAKIAANAVTLAKMATQAGNTILGEATGGTAVPTAISIPASRIFGRKASGNIGPMTLSETLDLIGSAAWGDILFRGTAGWQRLGAGTPGQYLKTMGVGANPVWATQSNVPFVSTQQTLTAGGTGAVAHGLGAAPSLVQMRMICLSNDGAWAAGEEVLVGGHTDASYGIFGYMDDATNVRWRVGSSGIILNGAAVTLSNWRLVVRAWL